MGKRGSESDSKSIDNQELDQSPKMSCHSSRRCNVLLALILSLHALMLGWCAYRDSPVVDEVPHLAAGLSHWKTGDFALYRSNPPLIRMVAALPVLFENPKYNWSSYSDGLVRSEFEVGWDFTLANGERTFWLYTLARWSCIPFSMLGGYICYRWSYELFGTKSAFYALFLWCFSPYVLTNGYLINPDMGATALGVTFFYFFWKWMKKPEWLGACLCGVLLGLTQLTKMTWIILYPSIPVLWFFYCHKNKTQRKSLFPRNEILQLSFLLFLSVFVLNAFYGFDESFTSLGDYEFQSSVFSGKEVTDSLDSGNRFSNSLLSELPVPLPHKYVTGIDLNKLIFEQNYYSYLRGELKRGGWWYYYLYGMLVKMPVGSLIVISLSLLLGIVSTFRIGFNKDVVFVLLPFLIILIFVSSNSGINRHTRYILPIFPFLFIAISHLANFLSFRHKMISCLIFLAGGWQMWSVLSSYPHQSSYFNEFAGGSVNGYKHLAMSNIGWGQNVLSLKRWLDQHPEVEDLHCALYCHFDPKTAGIDYKLSPSNPSAGWHAVSSHFLSGSRGRTPNGRSGLIPIQINEYKYFNRFIPVEKIGYTIFIYHLDKDDLNEIRKKHLASFKEDQ